MDLFDTIYFGEMSAKVFPPFLIRLFFILLSFKSYFYILINSSISKRVFARYFSHGGFSSHSLDTVFFRVDCFSSRWSPAYQLLLSWSLWLWCSIKKSSTILSSRTFVVLHFTFIQVWDFVFIAFKLRTISKQGLKILSIPCDKLSQSRHFCNYPLD